MTQIEIIKRLLENKSITPDEIYILTNQELLKNLKDFDFWKSWIHQTPSTEQNELTQIQKFRLN